MVVSEIINSSETFKSYMSSPYLSIKHSSYFQVYDDLFKEYKNKEIIFVEVGVLNGGSLFMWRNYFGPSARIIGIDANPMAKKWEADGFEIFIGDQSKPDFWFNFFNKIGSVDILLDDGGHTYEQQILSLFHSIPYINTGGIVIVEDVHTSYMGEFGYPSKYSFIEMAKKIIDSINSRFPGVPETLKLYRENVYSVNFFESIVCFKINKDKCFTSEPTSNNGISFGAEDLRYQSSVIDSVNKFQKLLSSALNPSNSNIFIKAFGRRIFFLIKRFFTKVNLIRLKKYFHD